MMRLQTDELSIPARTLVPLLEDLSVTDRDAERARRMLLEWDYVLDKNSSEAAIYVAWERRIQRNMHELFVPPPARAFIRGLAMKKIVDWLVAPPGEFGPNPTQGRDAVLLRSLDEAVNGLRQRLGNDMNRWRYGGEDYKHALIRHPLSPAVNEQIRAMLEVGPAPRGGNSYTLNNTGSGDNQTSGASFRIIVDTSDWDLAVGANNPGQSGDPEDQHYRDLFDLWANDRFFPVFYSRDRVESVGEQVTVLSPR
jgi:penicillin amidase